MASAAWLVHFNYDGRVSGYSKSFGYSVRAVRGEQAQSNSMVDNGDGTVTDAITGLMWQKDTAPGTYTWQEALAYAEGLMLAGYSNWRLPNRNELQTLVDYSRYNQTIDPLLASNTVSSVYWSSTTKASSTNLAWIVYFSYGNVGADLVLHNKLNSFYVRAVRAGQSGAFDDLDHFVISDISSPQTMGVLFSATITAVDENGNRLWAFNGSASLTSNLGSVSPTTVSMTSGQGTASVKLYNGGDTRLNCSGYGAYGYSNYFNVTGGSACSGMISGRVIDARGDIVYQADVKLHEPGGLVEDQTQTDANGRYSFTGIACGNYYVSASKNGKSNTTSIFPISSMAQPQGDIRLQINAGTGVTPVILVPGIMGSTLPGCIYPELPKKYPASRLYFWDFLGLCGWDELEDLLKANDFKVFRSPWDWRMKAEDVYENYLNENYLKDKIDDALVESTTGKVHIVAYSMGGLVVRSYIQSGSYRGDIDKFAMVGTPNLGSSNPYYIWEGGDPKAVADITDHGWKSIVDPYSNTIRLLWSKYFPFVPWSIMPHTVIREFVRKIAPSLRQLMNTEDFLMDEEGDWDVDTDGNENTWLKGLNNGTNGYNTPASVMSADGSDSKVEVRLFVGKKNDSTIEWIKTKNRDDPHFSNEKYEDGIPKWPMGAHVIKGLGDGTVPLESAKRPADDGWAYLYGPHSTKAICRWSKRINRRL